MTTDPMRAAHPLACNCRGTGSLYANEHAFGCPALAADTARPGLDDDPALDGTDGAHPAWWRGSDHGYAKGLAARLTEDRP